MYLVTVRNTGSRVNTTHRLQERLTNTKVRQSIKSQDIMKNKEQREKCRRGWPEEMTSKTNQKNSREFLKLAVRVNVNKKPLEVSVG